VRLGAVPAARRLLLFAPVPQQRPLHPAAHRPGPVPPPHLLRRLRVRDDDRDGHLHHLIIVIIIIIVPTPIGRGEADSAREDGGLGDAWVGEEEALEVAPARLAAERERNGTTYQKNNEKTNKSVFLYRLVSDSADQRGDAAEDKDQARDGAAASPGEQKKRHTRIYVCSNQP